MQEFLQYFIYLPMLSFAISLFMPRKNERLLSTMTLISLSTHLIGVLVFCLYWCLNEMPLLSIKQFTLFHSADIEIAVMFYYDKTTACFAIVGAFITVAVAFFSKYYIHRDEGFKRFHSALLLFYLSYNLLIFSGNFETLFIGWEVIGICSFILIAFYRNRYLPVKNSLKVISVYRVGDICLLLAMWMSHHLWHQNISFLKLQDIQAVTNMIDLHWAYVFFISLMIVIAAAVKSAQLPFSTWLPRAMEGPTTSSAIFYGSLSVHLGVFLLLRSYPLWENLLIIKVIIISLGVATSLVATSIARVQSSVKVQIAYSSIAQIGLMFIEVGLGFHILAIIHFAANAFLRTYQLLVSPSVMSYLIHDMVFNFKPNKKSTLQGLSLKLKNTIYLLAIKEWNLDFLLTYFLWNPFKFIGKKANVFSGKIIAIFVGLLLLAGLVCISISVQLSDIVFESLSYLYLIIGFMLIVQCFASRKSAIDAWGRIAAAHLSLLIAITFLNHEFEHYYSLLYVSGSMLCALLGYICLKKIMRIDNDISLNRFHGYVYEQPKIALLFFVACLGMAGLPLTPTFIGIDLMFSHVHPDQIVFILLVALCFMILELSLLRIYARIFLGQYKKPNHAMAYRSS